MAQHDVFALAGEEILLLDCQTDLLDDFGTRLVVPLRPIAQAPRGMPRLNPVFDLNGARYMMMTQQAGAIPRATLGQPIANFMDHHERIIAAFDMLLTGV